MLRDGGGDQFQDIVGEIDLRRKTFVLGNRAEGPLQHAVDMAREDDVGLRRIHSSALDLRMLLVFQRAEPRRERLADELLIDPTR